MNETVASSEDRNLAMLTHLSCILLGFIVPLIIWLTNKDKADKAWLTEQAKEALNFVITFAIGMTGLAIVATIFGFIPVLGWIISLLIFIVMGIVAAVGLVFIIIAAMKVNEGVDYRYPFALRLIK